MDQSAASICVYKTWHPVKSIKALFPSPTPSCSLLELEPISPALKRSESLFLLPPLRLPMITKMLTLDTRFHFDNPPSATVLVLSPSPKQLRAGYIQKSMPSIGSSCDLFRIGGAGCKWEHSWFSRKSLRHPRQHLESQQGIKDEQHSRLLLRSSFYKKKREIKKNVPTLPTVLLM